MHSIDYLREKAIILRKKGYSLTDICEMLNRGKSTVFYWIKGIKIEKANIFLKRKEKNYKESSLKAGFAVRNKYKKIHEEYKTKAIQEWETLKKDENFLLFIMAYLCEGSKRGKWTVCISNSDPYFILFNKKWFDKININNKEIEGQIHLHEDQSIEDNIKFWKNILNIDNITVMNKSNSNKLKTRNWNSKYGVMHLRFHDAYIKTKMDTWIDKLKEKISESSEEVSHRAWDAGVGSSILPSLTKYTGV